MKRFFCIMMALSMLGTGVCYGEGSAEEAESPNTENAIYSTENNAAEDNSEDFYPSNPSTGSDSAYTEDETKRIYDFDAADYGFYGNDQIADAIIYESELWAKVTDSNSYFTTGGDFSLDAAKVPKIQISYQNQTSGTKGKLYFITDAEKDYREENSYTFDINSGDGVYIINTEENTGWTGNIIGVRFVPSDGAGIVRIGSISFEKFDCTVSVLNGVVSVQGNMYGRSGNMTVKAINAETKSVDYSKRVSAKLDGSFTHSFSIAKAPDEPTAYDIVFSGSRLNGEFKKRIIYTSEESVKNILEKINNARMEQTAENLQLLLESNLKTLNLSAEHYAELLADHLHLDAFYSGLLGGKAESQAELEEQLNEQAVKIRVQYMTADQWLTAVEKYDSYIHFKELPAYATYEASSETVKKEIAEGMSQEKIESFDDVRNSFSKYIVLKKIAHAIAWGDVKDTLEVNAELIGIDFTEVNQLKNPSEVYRQLTEKNYESFSALKTAFDNAVQKQKEKETVTPTKKPLSGNGGGGGGVAGGYRPSATAVPTVQPTAEPTSEPTLQPTANPGNNGKTFDDLHGYEWAESAIEKLYSRDIVNGDQNKYDPARSIKREEFVKMIISAFNIPLMGDAEFTDVPKEAWYSVYIAAAAEAGIVKGNQGAFGVGLPISRQDAAVMLARALSIDGSAEEQPFTDEDEIADYAVNAVKALAEMKVLEGYDDGAFRPKNTLTRAEAAVIIDRMMEGTSSK